MTQKLTGGQREILGELHGGPITTDCRHVTAIDQLESLFMLDLVIKGGEDSDGRIMWTITRAGKESYSKGEVVPCKHPPVSQRVAFFTDENGREIMSVTCIDCWHVAEGLSPLARKKVK